ncbi:MAG: hypothetical protein OEN50_15145 [Deltaproteobacteria bacterium]|nr:hypothetical protein [Deltaproteobacteria bacterium]
MSYRRFHFSPFLPALVQIPSGTPHFFFHTPDIDEEQMSRNPLKRFDSVNLLLFSTVIRFGWVYVSSHLSTTAAATRRTGSSPVLFMADTVDLSGADIRENVKIDPED